MSSRSRADDISAPHTALLFVLFAAIPIISSLLFNSQRISTGSDTMSSMRDSPVGVGESTTVIAGQASSTTHVVSDPGAAQALLSPANVLSFLKILYSSSLYVLSVVLSVTHFIVVSVPKLASLPFIHGTRLTFSSFRLAMRPVLPILAPVIFAFKIVMLVIAGPLGALYALGRMMYPAYVFLGAAVVIGAVVGLFMRFVARILLEGVLGVQLVRQREEAYRPRGTGTNEKELQVKQRDSKKRADRQRKSYW